MIKPLQILAATIAICVATIPTFAIPAKLGVTSYRQPDGSTINIRLEGNANLHFATTEDGTLLTMGDDGFYQLAAVTNEGMVVATGIKASSDLAPTMGVKLNDVRAKIRKAGSSNPEPGKVSQSGLGKYSNNYPTKGEVKVPILLVEFNDVKFTEGYPEYFRNMVSGDFDMYDCPGNLQQYFEFQSKGKFTPKFDVYGPVSLPQNILYYASNAGQGWDVYANKMISDAAKEAFNNQGVKFSMYDEDKDGEIDFLYVVYAGYSEARGYDPNQTIWPNAGQIKKNGNFCIVDGVWVNTYACSNELISEGEFEGMANIIHEYSHIIGLPDLYTTGDKFHYNTPGPYSILDYGVYVNDGRTPPNYGAYELNALEWSYPFMVEDTGTIELDDISTGQFAMIATSDRNEFFLFENRQNKGWDQHLPAHGLLIYHIDYKKQDFENNAVNVDPDHQRVDLIEANDTPGFNINYGKEDANCNNWTFPGLTGNREFTFESTPAFATWNGDDPGLPITNIREINGLVIFDVAGGDPEYVDPEPDDIVSGINSLEGTTEGLNVVYNLTGTKVMETADPALLRTLPRGLYIINGRKVIISR